MEGSSGFMGQNQQFQGQTSSNISNFFRSVNSLIWTEEMVRLLITTISYLMEAAFGKRDDNNDASSSRNLTLMIKWKVISMVMAERGYNFTPQQCEDKFRDINNKYTKLISILGMAISYKVIENPIILDSLNMPARQKEEARKLLQSDQFLYRQMWSLHHGNHIYLPHDWELRRSVFLQNLAYNHGEQFKHQEGSSNGNGRNVNELKVLRDCWVQSEEKKFAIVKQRLQFEKTRFEWLRFSHNEELKLEKMRLESESFKFENALLAFELKRQEMTNGDGNN